MTMLKVKIQRLRSRNNRTLYLSFSELKRIKEKKQSHFFVVSVKPMDKRYYEREIWNSDSFSFEKGNEGQNVNVAD